MLAIIALLTAVLLPFIPRQTSRSRLQAYALQAATLLKADRNAAVRNQTSVATSVRRRRQARAIRSGASRDTIRIPDDVRFDALLAADLLPATGGAVDHQLFLPTAHVMRRHHSALTRFSTQATRFASIG